MKKLNSIKSIAFFAIIGTMVFFSSCEKNEDPTIEKETFTDSRDGKVYNIIEIGSQTWMAENFAYKPTEGYWAYNNEENNVSTYGYLYTLETAKSICPEGWHFPSLDEWNQLFDNLGGTELAGNKMKEAGGAHWNSDDYGNKDITNSSGFTALPGGKYEDAFDAFRNVLDTPQAYNDIGYLCMLDGYYDVAEHYYQKAIKTSPSYYLKAHENIDRLERQRERGSSTQQVRTPPRTAPTPMAKQTSSTHDNVIAVNEAGVPVVTIAPVSSAAIVDNAEIASANDVTIVEKKESAIPVESPTVTNSPKQSSLAEISQPTAASVTAKNQPVVKPSETSEINTQPKVADTAVSSTTDTTVNASVSNSDSNKKPASYSTQGEQADYRKALALVRDGEFEDAAESFNSFLEIYPESSYADNASYWIGETYYVTRDFEPALETFTGLVKEFPDSPKVPDTRLKIGYIHYEQHDWSAAHEELSSIVSTYPDTEVAQLANARLKRMEDEGH